MPRDFDDLRPVEHDRTETRPGRVAGPAGYDVAGRERHGDLTRDDARYDNRDGEPRPQDWSAEPSDGPLPDVDPTYAADVGALDRGTGSPLPAADTGLTDAGPYSGLEGTGPNTDDGKAGQTSAFSGKKTSLADRGGSS